MGRVKKMYKCQWLYHSGKRDLSGILKGLSMVSKLRAEKQMREFNTFGPVNPQRHYHVDQVAVKAALWVKIEKGRYLTLPTSLW